MHRWKFFSTHGLALSGICSGLYGVSDDGNVMKKIVHFVFRAYGAELIILAQFINQCLDAGL